MIHRILIALLLLEAGLVGGVFTVRYVLELEASLHYYTLWQQERVEREFWYEKVECAKKLNGCSLRKVEKRLRDAS